MARREFSDAVRVLAYKRAAGHCEGCTAPLRPGKFAYDHDLPDALGGEPTLENCRVLCSTCHDVKTSTKDVPTIARTKRVHRRHIGAKRTSRPMPGSKASGLRKRMDGTVERR